MKKNNWEKVEKIFHATLDLPSEERKTYLQKVCAGDARLFSEIESLINSLETKSAFLDEPVFELGLGAYHKNGRKSFTGTTIQSYEIQEKIGAGGMGEVYKAIDTHLNRRVALKFLSESLGDDRAAKRQLVREAQAAAALEHPNICAIHGIEQTGKHHYIVMQYIEGRTLAEIIEKETISVDEFKSLARQIATAVAFAHSHGIIHRDLKPGNIMLTNERQIKVLDFGLAKIIRQEAILASETDNKSNFSQNGLIIGTVSYMSPEQLRGEKIDFRSDIFSVGIILYELLAKENPFSRKSQPETIAAILSDESPVLEKIKSDFPASLINLVEKCLQKEPGKRFQSAAEVLVELDKPESENRRKTAAKRRRRFFVKTGLAAVFLLAVFLTAYFYALMHSRRTIAVLPISFEKPQPEKEYLSDGLTISIIDNLSDLSDLDVKNESLVTRYKGTITPREAGKELNADAVFAAAIQESPEGLILNFKLIRISDGELIDADKLKIDEAKLIEFHESIALRIIGKIQTKLTDEDRSKLAKKDTKSDLAQESYFLGRYHLKRRNEDDDVEKAIEFFSKAKDLDLNYAKAWAGLADAYLYLSTPGVKGAIPPKQGFDLAKKMANKALDLDYTLCAAHNSLGLINYRYEWDWKEAERRFRTAIACDAEFLPARLGLISVLRIQQRYDEAMAEAEAIKEIDLLSVDADIQIALTHYRKRDYDQMDKVLSESLKRNSDNKRLNNKRLKHTRVYQFLKTGRFNEAIEIFEPMYKSDNNNDKIFTAAALGFAYAKTQRRGEALKIIEELGTFKENYVPAQERALIYVGLGDYDKVFEFLNKSCDERFPSLPAWINEPIVDEVKSDPRFAAIKECAKL